MKAAPIPKDEQARLDALQGIGILDTDPEERFDAITREATKKLHVPISTITIIDEDREWYKSCQGLESTGGDRRISFCGHAILSKVMFIVEDTLKDPRFFDNPMVIGSPHIRFYAGVALYEKQSGQPIGVLCVKDTKPRTLTAQEVDILMQLAHKAEDELNTPSADSTQAKQP